MTATTGQHLGRNEPCHCGSGRKYKHCCLDKDEAAARTARADAEAAVPAGAAADQPAKVAGTRRPATPKTHQPWKRSATNTHGFQRMSTPRKVGGG